MEGLIGKRELVIENKIFTTSDILSLIKLFIRSSNLIQESIAGADFRKSYINTTHSHLEFTFSDYSVHTLKFAEISQAEEILQKNKIAEVSLFYSENISDTRFIIKIRESDINKGPSYAAIEVQDSHLAEKIIESIEELVLKCKNQTAFVKKFRIPIIAIINLILMFFLLNLVELFIRTRVIFPKIVGNMVTRDLFFVIIILCIIAATPSLYIFQLISRLYPRIEIQTGRNSCRLSNGKLFKLWGIILIVIIPAVVFYIIRLL